AEIICPVGSVVRIAQAQIEIFDELFYDRRIGIRLTKRSTIQEIRSQVRELLLKFWEHLRDMICCNSAVTVKTFKSAKIKIAHGWGIRRVGCDFLEVRNDECFRIWRRIFGYQMKAPHVVRRASRGASTQFSKIRIRALRRKQSTQFTFFFVVLRRVG